MKVPNLKAMIYFAIAGIACALCIPHNLPYYAKGYLPGTLAFLKDLEVTGAALSVSYDILIVYIMLSVWMWQVSKKIGRKYFFLGFFFSTTIAVAVGFPLFLGINEWKKSTLDV